MNSYATSARYMRLAVCALFLSLCGQTKCAGDENKKRIDLLTIVGAGLASASGIARWFYPPMSPLGMVLDLTCTGTNICAVNGYQQKAPTLFAFVDATCFVGLLLQYTPWVPALTLGVNDPLKPIRAVFSVANIFITGRRLLNNNYYQNTN